MFDEVRHVEVMDLGARQVHWEFADPALLLSRILEQSDVSIQITDTPSNDQTRNPNTSIYQLVRSQI